MYNPRNRTLKASPLNNRGYGDSRTPGQTTATGACTPTGCPNAAATGTLTGAPSRVDVPTATAILGCSLRSYPRLLSVDGSTVLRRTKTIEAMKRTYEKPAMTVVQLQHRTMLLSASMTETNGNTGLNYRGSDAYYDEDAR